MKKRSAASQTPSVDLARRRLITGAVGAGAAAGLGLLAVNSQAAEQPEVQAEPKQNSYRETEHIRRYYRSAQF